MEIIDQQQLQSGNGAGHGEFTGVRYRGQGFIPKLSTITAIAFERSKGSQGIKIFIYAADSNSLPTGSELYSWTVTNASITGAFQKFTLPTPLTVTPGSQYCFFVAPWNTTSNLYQDDYTDMWWKNANVYSRGFAIRNDNGTWSRESSGNFDLYFKVYGTVDLYDETLVPGVETGFNATSSYYAALSGGKNAANTTNAISAETKNICPATGAIGRFYMKLATAPGAGKSWKFSLMLNDEEACSLTISGTDTEGSNTVDIFAINAGDNLSIRATPTGTPATSNPYMSCISFLAAVSGETIVMGQSAGNLSTTSTFYGPVQGLRANGINATESDVLKILPTPGTFKKLYWAVGSDIGTSPDAFRATLRKSGAATALTSTITAEATSGDDIVNTVAVAAGEDISLSFEPLNTPLSAPTASWGLVFVPDTAGRCLVLGATHDDLSASATEYINPSTGGDLWNATETIGQIWVPACKMLNLYMELSGAPTAGDVVNDKYTFTLRDDAVDTALSVEVAGNNTTGQDTDVVDVPAASLISLKVVPNSTPTVRDARWGFVLRIGSEGGAAYSTTLTEIATLVDVMSRLTGKRLTDAVTPVDTVRKLTSRAIVEVATIVDTVTRATTRVRAYTEIVTVTDVVSKLSSRAFVEAVAVVDTVTKLTSRRIVDVVTIVDTVARQLTRAFTETVTTVDTVIKNTSKAIAESVVVTDTVSIIKAALKSLSETVTIADTMIRNIFASFRESLTVADNMTRTLSKAFIEALTTADTIYRATSKQLSEGLTATDTMARQVYRSFIERVEIADTVLRQSWKSFTESVTLVDSMISDLVQKVGKGITILLTKAKGAIIKLGGQKPTILRSKNKDKSVL